MTAFQRDVMCVNHWLGLLLLCIYNINDIHCLSSTTKYQPEMPDYVNNNNISGTSTSQLLRKYQVQGIKKEKKQGTEETKRKKNEK